MAYSRHRVHSRMMTNQQMTLQHHGIHYNPKKMPGKDYVLKLSLIANVVFIFALAYLSLVINQQENSRITISTAPITSTTTTSSDIVGYNQKWHGGHPAKERKGSCWCGEDDMYCMCTPNLAIDLIITSSEKTDGKADYFWLVRRKDTDQLATMGGFVDVAETVEQAVKRELKEEMAIDLKVPPKLVGVYSDPRRDNRRRTSSAVFAVHLTDDFQPHAGDDAKEVVKIHVEEIESHTYFSDHRTILLDYRRMLRGDIFEQSTEGDFAVDISRSTCSITGV